MGVPTGAIGQRAGETPWVVIVCIDTNVVIQARSKKHAYHPLLRGCVFGRWDWAVSQTILTEYREMITSLDGEASWKRFEQLLELIEASGNLRHCSPFFQFRLIHEDPDDNAFTD